MAANNVEDIFKLLDPSNQSILENYARNLYKSQTFKDNLETIISENVPIKLQEEIKEKYAVLRNEINRVMPEFIENDKQMEIYHNKNNEINNQLKKLADELMNIVQDTNQRINKILPSANIYALHSSFLCVLYRFSYQNIYIKSKFIHQSSKYEEDGNNYVHDYRTGLNMCINKEIDNILGYKNEET